MEIKNNIQNITYFAETNFRGRHIPFGIKKDDRRRHMYIIGKTGMGKTVLLENMAISDIRAGHGLAAIDPHCVLAERLLHFIPSQPFQRHRTSPQSPCPKNSNRDKIIKILRERYCAKREEVEAKIAKWSRS